MTARPSSQRRPTAPAARSRPSKIEVRIGTAKINDSWARMAERKGLRIMPRHEVHGWDFVPVGAMGEGLVYLRTSVMSSPYGEFPEGLRDWDMQILPKDVIKNIYCRRIVTGY